MSLAAAMLYGLPGDPEEVDDKTLVIDHYTRTITIPKGISNLGVENDDDVLRLNFKMPRYLGTTDLYTGFNFRVNYINAQGKDDYYDVEDATVAGDDILFTWRVGPTATAYRGTTRFNVSILKTDSDSVVQQGYHTAVASLNVKEGLECTKRPVSRYSDILDQWERRLFGFGDTEEAALAAVSAEQQEQIESKGAEVLATIPEDYTTTYNMANESVRTKADAIICSADGETIVVSDSSDDYLRGLKIFGKTEQVRTTGKNILNNTAQSAMINGITYTALGNGVIHANGTASDDSFLTIGAVTYTGGTEYRITGCPSGGAMNTYTLYSVYGDGLYSFDTGTGNTFTTATDMTKNVSIKITKGATVSNLLFKPMVCIASNTDRTYEPYSGGIASPSPEWPQDMASIENPTTIVYGQNLVDINQMVLGSNKSVAISDDGYTVTLVGGSDKTYAYSHYDIPVEVVYALRGRTVRLSSDFVSRSLENAYSPVQLNIKCEDNTFHYPVNHSTKLFHEFTVPYNTVEIRFGIYTNNTSSLLETDNTVVVKGVRFTLADNAGYEPYKPMGIVGTDYTLRGIPVTSGGNYTDPDGQQWICDEIDFERGVYIQRANTRTFDGSESWLIGEQNTDEGYLGVFYTAANDMVAGSTARCSHYVQGNSVGLFDKDGQFDTYYSQFRVNIGSFTTVQEWTNQLAEWNSSGNPLTLCYVLTTPIETALTADELDAFKALKSSNPSTTVLNDVGACMKVRYNADAKTWINNLIDEKIAAALANL